MRALWLNFAHIRFLTKPIWHVCLYVPIWYVRMAAHTGYGLECSIEPAEKRHMVDVEDVHTYDIYTIRWPTVTSEETK